MRARDLAEDFPVVRSDSGAWEATRLLAEQGLPGLVVLDAGGLPVVVLPASEVLRFSIPEYVQDDPGLARVVPEAEADLLCSRLVGRTVADLLPDRSQLIRRDRDRPIVSPDATALEIASVMSRQHSSIVAVVADGRVLGVITVHRLLGALLAAC
ncbi:MAG: CBS domain-containing protein [Nakamurella sp.]